MLELFPPMTHVPQSVLDTIRSSLSPSTIRVFDSYSLRFGKFLLQRQLGIDDVDTVIILEFLNQFASKKYSFSYIRSIRNAIVKAMALRRPNFTVDQVLLQQFMAGAKNECRMFTRKAVTWDAQVVIDFLASQPLPERNAQLAQETITILALATGARIDDLWKMGAAVYQEGRSTFIPFLEHQKTSRRAKNPRTGIRVTPFPNERVCPVRLVRRYITMTTLPGRVNFLFVRSDDGQRAEKATLRSWLVSTLQRAGIVATAGSTRAASASYADASNLSFDQIAQMTGWLRESTFTTHYRRTIVPSGGNLMLRKAKKETRV
jgi:integrase